MVRQLFKKLSLGIKVNLVVVVVLGILLAVIIALLSNRIGNLTSETGRRRVEEEAGVVQGRFDEAAHEVLADTKLLATTPNLVEAVAHRDTSEVRTAILIGAAPHDFDDISVVDAESVRVAAVPQEGKSPDIRQEDALLRFALLGIEATGSIVNEEELRIRLAAVVPLRDASGTIVGALLAGREVDDEFLAEINFSRQDIHLTILHEGQILARSWAKEDRISTLGEQVSTALLDPYATRQALSGQTLTADDLVSIGGAPYALAHTPLTVSGETKAVIGILVNLGELTAFQRRLTSGLTIAFAFLALAAMGAMAMLVRQSVSIPLHKLQSATERMASGDYQQHAEVTTEDEVGQLASAFNNMSARLKDSLGALQERTHELEASQRVTFAASEHTNPDALLGLVVDLIRDQFDLYHVQMYLTDEERQAAVLRESTGYAGRQLLQKGHHIPLDQTALVTKAIHEGQPVLVEDVSQDENFLPNPLLPYTQSELVVPLEVEGQVIGALDVQSRVAGAFSPSKVTLFETLIEQIALLFRNSELFTRTTEQAEALIQFTTQLRTAAEIAGRLGAILDPALLLQEVVSLMQSRFGLYHVHVYVLDETKRELVVRAGSGEVGRVLCERGHSIPFDRKKSLVARAARGRQTVLVDDVSLVSDFMPNPLLPQTRSEMAVPLLAGGRLVGVLDVQDDQRHRFNQADLNTFSTLAGQIATALDNARLFEEQKRAEEALRESEERLRTILEASPIPTVVSRVTDGVVLYVNEQLGEMFGLSPEEAIGLQTPDFYCDPADRQAVLEALQKDGYLYQYECRLKKVDGTPFWAILSLQIITLEGGAAILSGIYDITERKQAEEERARFTNQLRTAADLTEWINTILDPDQLLLEVVTQLHERFDLYHVHIYLLDEPSQELLKELDLDEVGRIMRQRQLVMRAGSGGVGQKLLEQGHSIPITREQSLVARAARTRQIVSVGDTSTEPDFMPNPLLPETRSEVAVPLVVGDKVLGVLDVGDKVLGVLDVQDNHPHRFTPTDLDAFSTLAGQIATTLQNAALFEKIQQTTERLREVDRLKSEFLANMSHELRTPLNSILGYTELLLMNLEEELDPETLQDIQAIHDNGQHLLNIINNILDLAKIEAGRMTLNLEEVMIEPLLDELKNSTIGLLVNRPIDLRIEVEDDLPPIQADPVRLHQILNNLVANAVKFTDKGHVTLHAFSDPDEGDASGNGWVCIQVQDTGVGISEADLKSIFDKFRQADGSFTRRAEGTGLGLSITLHLVLMHGGTIDVRSQLGQGSTFTVRLPVQRQGAKATTGSADGRM
jgi:PAS domain S-box-containing protein